MFGSIRSASEDTASDWDEVRQGVLSRTHKRSLSGQDVQTPATPATPLAYFDDSDHFEITRTGTLTKKKEKIMSQDVTEGEYVLTGSSENDGKFSIQIKLSRHGKTFLDIRQEWDGASPLSMMSGSWDPSPKLLSRSPQMSSPLSSGSLAPSMRPIYEQHFFVTAAQSPAHIELTLARICEKTPRKAGSPFVSTPSSLSTSPPFSSYLSAREPPCNPRFSFRLAKVQNQASSVLRVADTAPEFRWKKSDSIIGRGALGTVYLGMDLSTGELVAIKQVDVNSKNFKSEALESEINYLKALSHPNIVRYLGMQRTSKYIYIYLEYVPGGSIESLLQKFRRFPESIVQLFSRQILLGLQYLHEHGVLHRDIKGGNILVDKNGAIKLSDFGSAKMIDFDLASNEKKQITGTPSFMPKEVIREAKYSNASDIWSFGCTVLQMLTGQYPWSHLTNLTTPVAVMYHIANTNETPIIPDWISETAKNFLSICFQIDPKERPSTAHLLNHPFITDKIEPPTTSLATAASKASLDAEMNGDGDSSSSSNWSVNESASITTDLATDAHQTSTLASSAVISYVTPNEEFSLDMLRNTFDSVPESAPEKGITPPASSATTATTTPSSSDDERHSLDYFNAPTHIQPQTQHPASQNSTPAPATPTHPIPSTDRKSIDIANNNNHTNNHSSSNTSYGTGMGGQAVRPRSVSANATSKCASISTKLFGAVPSCGAPRQLSTGQTSPQPSTSPRQPQYKSPRQSSPPTQSIVTPPSQQQPSQSYLTLSRIFQWLGKHSGKISARSVLDADSAEDEIQL